MGASHGKEMQWPAEPGFGTGLLQRTAAHILEGNDVVVLTPLGGGPVLDLLAIALAARKCRVLRATGEGEGGREGLVAQLNADAGMAVNAASLALPGPGCTRTVLLVAQAHRLTRDEYRFLHRATKEGPLQLVLAAPVDPVTHLDDDLVPLHNRIASYAPLVIEPGTPLAVLVPPRPPSASLAAGGVGTPAAQPAGVPARPDQVRPAQVRQAQVRQARVLSAARAPDRSATPGSMRRVRTGWLVAIGASALVTLAGAQIQFDWLGRGTGIVSPAMASPAIGARPAASFVTLPAPVVAAPDPATAPSAAQAAAQRNRARQPEAPAR